MFFLISAITIYRRNSVRVPTQSTSLAREAVQGAATPAPSTAATPEPNQTPVAGVGFTLNEFHRSLVKDGKTVWEIRGAHGNYDPSQAQARIDKPDLNVMRDNGDTIHLTADKADLTLSGTQLSAAELIYNVVAV